MDDPVKRTVFEEEHDLLRSSWRQFLDKEVVPPIDEFDLRPHERDHEGDHRPRVGAVRPRTVRTTGDER